MSDVVEVRLGNSGHVALIDAEDLPKLEGWRFYYWKRPNRRTAYAIGRSKMVKGVTKSCWLHRLVMDAKDPKVGIDHENGDGLDCRKSNLRPSTQAQNNMNQRARENGSSLFKGVAWVTRRKKWIATIRAAGRFLHIGYFDEEVDAAMAYDDASRKHHGSWGKTNETEGLLPTWIEEDDSLFPA